MDLGRERLVSKIKLTVTQYPSGDTLHKFYGESSNGQTFFLGQISGFTLDGQVISLNLTNVTSMRFIKVETINSPSWVALSEIKVYTPSREAEIELPIISASASHVYANHIASLATDDNQTTAWSSGVFASSKPWIEIDLGKDTLLSRLELTPAQHPSGFSKHVIYGRASNGQETILGEISELTSNAITISHQITRTVSVRHIRIETITSPSWIAWYEIKAYAPNEKLAILGAIRAGTSSAAVDIAVNDLITPYKTNTIMVQTPFEDVFWLANTIKNLPDNTNVVIDSTGIFFGGNTIKYFGDVRAKNNWTKFMAEFQGHPKDYQKIRAILLIDEPDLKTGHISANDLAASAAIIRDVHNRPQELGGLDAPKVAITYSYVGLANNSLPGLEFADWVAFNCYPISSNSKDSWSSCGNGDSDGDGVDDVAIPQSIPEYLSLLKSKIRSNQKVYLFPQTFLWGNDSDTKRQQLITNIKRFRDLALLDPQLVGVFNFSWDSFDGALGLSDLPNRPINSDYLNVQDAVKNANLCITAPSAVNCK